MLSRSRLATLAGAALVSATAAGAYAAGAAREAPAQATRIVLAQVVDPAGGRGRTLALSRVTIPPERDSGCTATRAPRSRTSRRAH